ncbi:uncharacterized protein LOC114711487 [Neltuma alba]|uniref:uncharacterized protein LOC114711487 n=1 Tax=Neltuma alba TaxID=207710 RepID=UPI0010A4A627|nr:uncharacterized protein LOC114711487 [Prosopis alba]
MAIVLSGKNTNRIPQSAEEDDLLMRSSKKIKNVSPHANEEANMDQWPKLGTKAKPYQKTGLSFAETLKSVNRQEECTEDEKEVDDEMSEDSLSDSLELEQGKKEPLVKIREDPTRNFPMFHFSGRLKKKLYRAWKKAVIVKLLDRHIGYKALESRLQALWARKGVISLINIGYGYFEPRFNPAKATIDKVAVWVRLPRISLEYYDEEALTIIGNRIGETLKVDVNTSCQLRGHYARICVLIDLGKQLMSGFSLDREEYFVEHEGLHSLCVNCGVYGHRSETCPAKKTATMNRDNYKAEEVAEGQKPETAGNGIVINENEQWRVVQKTRRQRKGKEKQGDIFRQQSSGIQFDLLADMDNNIDLTKEMENNVLPANQNVQFVQHDSAFANAVQSVRNKKNVQKRSQQKRSGGILEVVPAPNVETRVAREIEGRREKSSRELFTNHIRNNEIQMLTLEESKEDDTGHDGIIGEKEREYTEIGQENKEMEYLAEGSQWPHDPNDARTDNKANSDGPSNLSQSPNEVEISDQEIGSFVPAMAIEN